jgi:hypothetical protein
MHHHPEADPHVEWFAEWQKLDNLWSGSDAPKVAKLDDAPEGRRWQELFDLILETPGTGLATAEIQLTLALQVLGCGGAGRDETVHRESDDPGVRGLRNALATLRRAQAELLVLLLRERESSKHLAAALGRLDATLAKIESPAG